MKSQARNASRTAAWAFFALLLAVASLLGNSVSGQATTYTATGSGWTSLDQGISQLSFEFESTNLPNGGKMLTGGGSQEIRDPGSSAIIAVGAYGGGGAVAKPGSLGVSANGIATVAGPGTLGGHVKGNFGGTSLEYIPITSSTLPIGSPVSFLSSYHLNGVSSSEIPSNGPYQYSGFPYPTGTFFFMFTAYTVNGTSLAYNGDAVGSGTYSFPNGLFTSIPKALDFGQSFAMNAKVGDYLVINTVLGLGVEDRAYDGYGNFQESHLDFSHTVNMYVDPVTPGISFIANGHNYTSTVPEPSSLLVLGIGLVCLFSLRQRRDL
jgi:PEP-CTERM motif-containing protein